VTARALARAGAFAAIVSAFIAAAAPGAAQAPSPAPPAPRCARADVPPSVLRTVEPDTPPMAQQQGITGIVAVDVSLDESSRVVSTRIRSSPSALLNAAALNAARSSVYQTAIRDCKPVPADYVLRVDFSAGAGVGGVTPAGDPTIRAATPPALIDVRAEVTATYLIKQ
jgi:TonB family protein